MMKINIPIELIDLRVTSL